MALNVNFLLQKCKQISNIWFDILLSDVLCGPFSVIPSTEGWNSVLVLNEEPRYRQRTWIIPNSVCSSRALKTSLSLLVFAVRFTVLVLRKPYAICSFHFHYSVVFLFFSHSDVCYGSASRCRVYSEASTVKVIYLAIAITVSKIHVCDFVSNSCNKELKLPWFFGVFVVRAINKCAECWRAKFFARDTLIGWRCHRSESSRKWVIRLQLELHWLVIVCKNVSSVICVQRTAIDVLNFDRMQCF